MSENLRDELLRRNAEALRVHLPTFDGLPKQVDEYQDLVPLEVPNQRSRKPFNQVCTVYKAQAKDGVYYCLHRIHGFKLSALPSSIEKWKNLEHPNVVRLRKVFTTKEFGDNSIVFAYDYVAGALTMRQTYENFKNPHQIEEVRIWSYLIQLASAFRFIHQKELAVQCLHPSKILMISNSRVLLNCCGIGDLLQMSAHNARSDGTSSPSLAELHQQDMRALGQLLVCLVYGVTYFDRPDLNNYYQRCLADGSLSFDYKNIVQYLFTETAADAHKSVNDIMPRIGARFFTQLDMAHVRADVLENELCREMECGRLFRLLAKLCVVVQRAPNGDASWCNTQERHALELFRNYLFHQTYPGTDNRPFLELAHVINCLNKLDAGSPEMVLLQAQKSNSMIVYSYSDLKHYLETSFNELEMSSQHHQRQHHHQTGGGGANQYFMAN